MSDEKLIEIISGYFPIYSQDAFVKEAENALRIYDVKIDKFDLVFEDKFRELFGEKTTKDIRDSLEAYWNWVYTQKYRITTE